MAGIYIHIPFCRQACHYCNFHFSTSLQLKNDFVRALLKEIALQQKYLTGQPVHTIYFGGGTPSLLSIGELQQIMSALREHHSISAGVEVTLEANPDDITSEKIQLWKMAGVNRLSIGVQSFFEEDLRWMNRAHTAIQAVDCIRRAQDAGISNLTIDLIYGGPTLPDDRWQHNVQQAIDLQVPHLSCYALTVEPGTALNALIGKKKMSEVSTEDQARQFLLLMEWLQQAGYEHYEISNFALPGKRSRHNSSYWQGAHYLGMGPSAHSFNGVSRQWNVANNALYIKSLAQGTVPFEVEVLTDTQKLNEYIMTSLRTIEGLDLGYVKRLFGKELAPIPGKLELVDGRLVLTKEGKLFADAITADLFF